MQSEKCLFYFCVKHYANVFCSVFGWMMMKMGVHDHIVID